MHRLAQLKQKNLNNALQNPAYSKRTKENNLSISHLNSVFSILFTGLFISIVAFSLEALFVVVSLIKHKNVIFKMTIY